MWALRSLGFNLQDGHCIISNLSLKLRNHSPPYWRSCTYSQIILSDARGSLHSNPFTATGNWLNYTVQIQIICLNFYLPHLIHQRFLPRSSDISLRPCWWKPVTSSSRKFQTIPKFQTQFYTKISAPLIISTIAFRTTTFKTITFA